MSNLDSLEDAELVAKFVNGNWEAANTLYFRYQEKFYNLAFYMCGDPEVAEDIVTINASKIFYALQAGEEISFSLAMYESIIQDSLNRANETKESPKMEIINIKTEASERLEFLAGTLLSIPFEYRAVFVVKEFLELPKHECCKVLKISDVDFKLRLQRTRRILARALRESRETEQLPVVATDETNLDIASVSK